MQEFINPKSMLTPGVAGSLMMFLVNGITFQFPEIPERYLGLFLSFLIGAIVWFSEISGKSLALKKAGYWILNSLIIFVVGFGTANLATDATAGVSRVGINNAQLLSFVSAAFAQDASTQKTLPPSGLDQGKVTIHGSPGSQSQEPLRKQLERERAENERLKKQLESAQRQKEIAMPLKNKEKFFKRW